ncbi:hypothetical protein U8527_12495 [Kordia algicida OT-1]|uniref:Uncharacterized protein n=1 Tax=Kordia algicida OT-1 TaxID=391587 RepID=A9EBI6_9FLAO|nr:hypothetical protein [Kordia algicida]EDP94477.1 hypothetical protein KAOT1_06057 [Kordia algicida OT-1]
MRFSNAKSKKWVPFLYFFLGIGSILIMLYLFLFREDFKTVGVWYSIPVMLLLVFLIFYSTAKYFEFDSDGNVLTFVNKGLFISNFINYREHRAEFPKEKLKRYRLQNYILFSFLYIYVKSKTNQIKRVRFNISLLSGTKKRALKKSLDKVIKHNNQIS